jgi:H+/Cl- antiporter ClcA
MPESPSPSNASTPTRAPALWISALLLTALASGISGAFFLWSLDLVTRWHRTEPRLIWTLPLLGIGIWWIYQATAGNASRGTNLLIEEARNPTGNVPFRLAPLILLTTLMTHLGGGSAGREGTAVQLGGGLAGGIAHWMRLSHAQTRIVLLAGMAAGFGAVFGTPWAGALFAVECIRPERPDWRSLPACVLAAWMGHGVCMACGAHHADFDLGLAAHPKDWTGILQPLWLFGAVVGGLIFGGVARLYVLTGKTAAKGFGRIRIPWVRPAIGGLLIAVLTSALDDRSYLGLGAVPMDPGNASIQTAFTGGPIPPWAWAEKLVFTALTLGSGFKGGEVTPLFFIGSTLGFVLAQAAGIPTGLGAAMGLTAVFGGASRAPIATTVLGIEMFGLRAGPFIALACASAAWSCGRHGIYEAQLAPMKAETKPSPVPNTPP